MRIPDDYMMNAVIFAGLFVGIMTSILVPVYSDYLSPREQLESGVLPEDIQCRENRVLVIRDNSRIACVQESTADKMNWDVITTEFEPNNDNSTTKKNTLLSREELREITEYNISSPLLQKKSFDGLKQIANPEGYWVPIVNKDVFVEKFLNAVGDEMVEIKETSIHTTYHTKDGVLTISHDSVHLNYFSPSVNYLSTDTAYDRQSQMEYVNNFMNKMELKVKGNDVSLSESFIDGCLKVWSGYSCSKLNEPFLISIDSYNKYSTDYNFKGEHGNIKFIFNNKAHYAYSDYGINIKFNGWSNYPEIVREVLNDLKDNKSIIDSETAKNKAFEFAEAGYALYTTNEKDSWSGCSWEYYEDENKKRAIIKIVSGVPFYQVQLGICLTYYESGHEASYRLPYFMVDAWNGDFIYIQHKLVEY